MTKICIFGAGAIGGYMAHALIKAGADVSLIARGPHLEGLRDKGLTLIKEGRAETLPVKATDTPEELGPQDYVISALKAHSVAPVIDRFKPLLAEHTALVPAVNGIPWWYFYKAGSDSAMENRWLETSDPGGVQWAAFGPERAIGCVVYPACEISAPGQITLKSGDRFTLGEPDGQRSDRVSTSDTVDLVDTGETGRRQDHGVDLTMGRWRHHDNVLYPRHLGRNRIH